MREDHIQGQEVISHQDNEVQNSSRASRVSPRLSEKDIARSHCSAGKIPDESNSH